MIIRELYYEDIVGYEESILELLIDTYMVSFNQLSREKCRDLCQNKMNELLTFINQGNATVIGAFIDVELVGFQWLFKHEVFGEMRVHLNQIAVKNQHRGKGIGTQLVRAAEEQARQHGINVVDLFVSELNTEASNLYERLGFITERRYMKKIVGE